MNVYLYVAGPKTMRTVLYYLYQMAAYIRKLFMSSASSAIGTGTVLGIHSAMAPAAPSIQGSDIRDAKVDDSKNLMKFDFYGGSSFFMIMLMILPIHTYIHRYPFSRRIVFNYHRENLINK